MQPFYTNTRNHVPGGSLKFSLPVSWITNFSSERLSDLPKVTQQASGGAGSYPTPKFNGKACDLYPLASTGSTNHQLSTKGVTMIITENSSTGPLNTDHTHNSIVSGAIHTPGESMLLNRGVGQGSRETLGLQADPTSPS